jgi:hypothetical protein
MYSTTKYSSRMPKPRAVQPSLLRDDQVYNIYPIGAERPALLGGKKVNLRVVDYYREQGGPREHQLAPVFELAANAWATNRVRWVAGIDPETFKLTAYKVPPRLVRSRSRSRVH